MLRYSQAIGAGSIGEQRVPGQYSRCAVAFGSRIVQLDPLQIFCGLQLFR